MAFLMMYLMWCAVKNFQEHLKNIILKAGKPSKITRFVSACITYLVTGFITSTIASWCFQVKLAI